MAIVKKSTSTETQIVKAIQEHENGRDMKKLWQFFNGRELRINFVIFNFSVLALVHLQQCGYFFQGEFFMILPL
jgi:hypothetical protein